MILMEPPLSTMIVYFEDMSPRIFFTLLPNLDRVYVSISSLRFETPILVAGLMLLNRR